MRPRDLAAYSFLAVTWGFSFMAVLQAVQAFGWVGAVAFRALIAGACLWAGARLIGRKLDFSLGFWPLAIIALTTVSGQLVGISYATPRIGTAMAAILVVSVPIFSMIISRLWGLEPITPERIAGIVLGVLGIGMLVGFPAFAITGEFLLGCAGVLAGYLCAAFGSVYASRKLEGTGAIEITIGAFLIGGAVLLPLLWLVPVPTRPAPFDYAYLALLGVLMSATTYVVYFNLVAAIGATRAVTVEFAVTAIAVIAGAVVLGERLTAIQLLGGALVLSGCALVLGLIPLRKARGEIAVDGAGE